MGFFDRLRARGPGRPPEASFWAWFATHSDRLLAVTSADEPVCDELMRQLQKVGGGLWFEFGPDEAGRREFVVSADGARELFPAVRRLVAAAPDLTRWTVIAFRPRKGTDFVIEMGGRKVGHEDVWFREEPDGDRVGLTLYLRGLDAKNEDVLGQASFIMLDTALGEYDVVTKVGFVERRPLPADPASEGLRPFAQLPDAVDALATPRRGD